MLSKVRSLPARMRVWLLTQQPNCGGAWSDEVTGSVIMTIAEKLEKKGMVEGMEKGKAEVALGLLREGISLEVISKTTGLSEEEIERLR